MSYHDLSVDGPIALAIHNLPCTNPPPRHRLRHLQRGNPSRMLHCHRRRCRRCRHRIPHLWALQQHANAKKAFSKSVAVMGLPIGALHLDAETANSWSSIAAFVVLISAIESIRFAGDCDPESHARLKKVRKTRVPSFRLDGVALRKIDPTSVITCLRSSTAARLWPPRLNLLADQCTEELACRQVEHRSSIGKRGRCGILLASDAAEASQSSDDTKQVREFYMRIC